MNRVLQPAEAADRLRGIGLYCLALLTFTALDTGAKYASATLPPLEIAWVRFGVHALVVAIVLRPWRDWSLYRTKRPLRQILRSVFLFLSTVFNFFALRELQLDETLTINFGSVFTVAVLAGPFLGEWVGPRRWAAIIVGFVGVIVVTQPGSAAFNPVILFSIGSMLSYAGYILLTRQLAATESPPSLLLYSGLIPAAMLTPIALPIAEWPSTAAVAIALAVAGIAGALGHWLLIHAHRVAPASVLAPFSYTQLVWMTGSGYFFFSDLPSRATLIGAAIIIASGLYLLYRERVHGDR
jgi:drug/metabolite transporter (DMT)-like permease